ncbi:winged helix-turn-helix domain-containing protein [Citricoccus sp. SGAir0253]|uniref:winged helix-turn-helix domain-containing protein n=1 Tax=Citricoccus sp. SGAir0253 TaxID=2567881 RepID=UPI0010CD10CC|nr:crosslink repair DNA glycosylase YcaQ family protein [Citricoccus sp. SGAir0253]QCU77751.1 winged helix-turn-helix domain-containing protein [Citricoccus sp. SGAir0253]
MPATPPPSSPPLLGPSEVRRTVLAAQVLDRARPTGPAGARRLRSVLEQLSVLQVDSVNVLARAHYVPLYSRLGPYDTAALDRLSHRAPRQWTEYWAHEASLVPVRLRPALVAVQRRTWMTARDLDPQLREELSRRILEVLSGPRPLTARQVEVRLGGHGRAEGHWGWNWSVVKRVLEDLFAAGLVASAGRTAQFERRFLAADRLLPAAELPEPGAAAVELVRAASRALGVATTASLADYYRITVAQARDAVGHLRGGGELEPVLMPGPRGTAVPGWRHREARTPRRATGRALVSPFDPLVFHRPRVEALFGVRYRIGIYTPAARRTRGYYPLLFLLGERLAAQVDLKADRSAGVLRVQGAWPEDPDGVPGAAPGPATAAPGRTRAAGTGHVAAELAAELRELAGWLGLGDVVVPPDAPGRLAPELARALRKLPAN